MGVLIGERVCIDVSLFNFSLGLNINVSVSKALAELMYTGLS